MTDLKADLSALCLSYLKPPNYAGGSWTLNPDALADAILNRYRLWPKADLPPKYGPDGLPDETDPATLEWLNGPLSDLRHQHVPAMPKTKPT
jgi:hypothetical protein